MYWAALWACHRVASGYTERWQKPSGFPMSNWPVRVIELGGKPGWKLVDWSDPWPVLSWLYSVCLPGETIGMRVSKVQCCWGQQGKKRCKFITQMMAIVTLTTTMISSFVIWIDIHDNSRSPSEIAMWFFPFQLSTPRAPSHPIHRSAPI